MKQEIEKKVIEHGNKLIKLFRLDEKTNPINLCRALRRLEEEAEKMAISFCNGDINIDESDIIENKLLNKLDSLLHFRDLNMSDDIFINTDCRGYQLKIKDKFLRTIENNPESYFYQLNLYKDWGGYGILAPEFKGDD